MRFENKVISDTSVKAMLDERFPEGLMRVLWSKFPGSRHHDREDAIWTGFEKLATADRVIANPRGYVTTVAINAMKSTLAKAAVERLTLDDPDRTDEEGILDAWVDPTGDEVVAEQTYALMCELVDAWESRNVKTTTRLVLRAARLGEPIPSDELAEELEAILGQEVSPATARQWRKRGLDRLRRQLYEADLLEGTQE